MLTLSLEYTAVIGGLLGLLIVGYVMLLLFITKGFLFIRLNFKPILLFVLVYEFKAEFTYIGLLAVFCSDGEVSIFTDSGLD